MKRVLVDYQGGVCNIVVPNGDLKEDACYVSNEFPVNEGSDASSRWVDAPDEVDCFWRLEAGEWVDRSESFTDPIRARQVAYKSVGEQLDMLYRDMVNGTTNWQEHITKVKNDIPKDVELSNKIAHEPITHSMDRPSWTYIPGWDDQITL
jgi:hypothetical protein